jgi:hypothetical protein
LNVVSWFLLGKGRGEVADLSTQKRDVLDGIANGFDITTCIFPDERLCGLTRRLGEKWHQEPDALARRWVFEVGRSKIRKSGCFAVANINPRPNRARHFHAQSIEVAA